MALVTNYILDGNDDTMELPAGGTIYAFGIQCFCPLPAFVCKDFHKSIQVPAGSNFFQVMSGGFETTGLPFLKGSLIFSYIVK